ncbi:hypothetical protein A2U01_0074584, partial [Trifolium medium]|nr:hypothetical protein [Trifolium medium]
MSRSGPLTRSRAIAAIQQGEPSNLHDVEVIPEPLNTATKLLSLLLDCSLASGPVYRR